MKPTTYIHIGLHKTGTTSIQHFLFNNRKQLLSQGVLYPESLRNKNQIALTAYCLDDSKTDGSRNQFQIKEGSSLEAFRKSIDEALNNEVEASRCSKVVLSNEHCSKSLVTLSEIKRLHSLASNFSSAVKVVLYLRSQDEMVLGLYSTLIKNGYTESLSLEKIAANFPLNYYELLNKWSEVFGKENVIVKVFDRKRLFNKDLLDDFMQVVGLDHAVQYTRPKDLNKSLDSTSLEWLRIFNQYIGGKFSDDGINLYRENVVEILEDHSSGGKLSLPGTLRQAIFQKYGESNDLVCREFLGELPPLFRNEDKQIGDAKQDPGIEDCLQLFSFLWKHKCDEVLKHKVASLQARGRLAYERQQYEEAARFYEKLTTLRPEDALALRFLGKIYIDLGQYDKALQAILSAVQAQPSDVELMLHGARISLMANNAEQAKELSVNILRIDKDNLAALEILKKINV